MNSAGQGLAEKIARACRDGGMVAWTPDDVPPDAGSAMQAQADIARHLASPVAGWKVAMPPDQPPVTAPIFAFHTARSGDTIILPQGQELKLEVELYVRLARDLPPRPRQPYASAEIVAAIDALHVGVELCPQRFASEPAPPFPLHLANNMANGGYVLGPRVDAARLREPPVWPVTLTQNGRTIYDKPGYHADGDPMLPLAAYLSQPNDLMGGPRAGQFITTGSFCGAVLVCGGGIFTASLGNLGSVTFTLGG